MVHIISLVTLAALIAAALLAACPSCCQMGLLHPLSRGQPPIRQWEQLLLNQLSLVSVLSYFTPMLHLHNEKHTTQINEQAGGANKHSVILLICMTSSNLNLEVEVGVRMFLS